MNEAGKAIQTFPYPLATDVDSAPERFRAMLCGSGENDMGMIRADDMYGVMRSKCAAVFIHMAAFTVRIAF